VPPTGVSLLSVSPSQHEKPTGEHVRVYFDADGETEALWGELIGSDTVRPDSIPLLPFGVSLGDVVRVVPSEDRLRFSEVVSRGGHSTYRILFAAENDDLAVRWLADLLDLGCGHEGLSPRFVAVDVPPSLNIRQVYNVLEAGMAAGAWTFEEGHCGHEVDGV
jgi:hypothetical protein